MTLLGLNVPLPGAIAGVLWTSDNQCFLSFCTVLGPFSSLSAQSRLKPGGWASPDISPFSVMNFPVRRDRMRDYHPFHWWADPKAMPA